MVYYRYIVAYNDVGHSRQLWPTWRGPCLKEGWYPIA